MMHKISQYLPDYSCYFTPYFADGLLGFLSKIGLLNFSILGGKHRRATELYLAENHLSVDYQGKARRYDLVITCSDLIIQKNIRKSRIILVQEGMTEPEGLMFKLVKWFKLPRWLANTATTGLSDAYDLFCVASPGYRDLFISKGVKREKILVTGIPNFDHAAAYIQNDVPEKDYVLVATSCNRENFKWDNRMEFLRKAVQIANGRPLIFKLHPNEMAELATWEIKKIAPLAKVITKGDIGPLIANCQALVTQTTSAVFIGIALGKEVYSYFDRNELKRLMPLQNGGTSAQKIAIASRHVFNTPRSQLKSVARKLRRQLGWQTTPSS
jgi:hypothetical protein